MLASNSGRHCTKNIERRADANIRRRAYLIAGEAIQSPEPTRFTAQPHLAAGADHAFISDLSHGRHAQIADLAGEYQTTQQTDDCTLLVTLSRAHEVFPNNRLVTCFHQRAMPHIKSNGKSISLVEVHRFM
ncbi:disease resistance protein [Striga asiatica]|uniref:Disease resistance protein n=1 Tax=Striga asiatica TaxID=4170 RepID=A0A5A7Q5Q5_STRAF|nr:disease resistance protein [Striga asiatica]